MNKPLTHKQLAAALKVSRPYITKLVALGMPSDSIPNAKRWLREQKKASGTGKNAPTSINAARVENILLRNQLLKLEIAQAEDTSELISVDRLTDAVRHMLVWGRVAGRSAAELGAEDLAAAGRPQDTYRIAISIVNDTLFDGMIAGLAASKLKNDDPRLFTLVADAVKKAKGLSEEEITAFVAGFSESVARNIETLAPREAMLSKTLVDASAERASERISRHLDELLSAVACRLPGESVPANINLMLDHVRPVVAEIDREISLFRIEVGSSAPPSLTLEAVNDQCAKFWRNWERVSALRAAGFERLAK